MILKCLNCSGDIKITEQKLRHFCVQAVFDNGVAGDNELRAVTFSEAVQLFVSNCSAEMGNLRSITVSEVF